MFRIKIKILCEKLWNINWLSYMRNHVFLFNWIIIWKRVEKFPVGRAFSWSCTSINLESVIIVLLSFNCYRKKRIICKDCTGLLDQKQMWARAVWVKERKIEARHTSFFGMKRRTSQVDWFHFQHKDNFFNLIRDSKIRFNCVDSTFNSILYF